MRIAIIAVGILASVMALTINSIYGLWYLCADLVYVVLFPQLLCVVYFERSNTYGCLLGYAMGLLMRLSGGEPMLFFPATIHYPMYDVETGTQYFPFKTVSMLVSLSCCVFGSLATEYLFKSGRLSPELDVLGCVVNIDSQRVILPSDTSFNVSCETLAMQKIRSDNSMVNVENGYSNGGGLLTESTALHPNHHDYGAGR
uniref:High-affinity choline transporter 1 n=1 Tax=Ditylenchus dipsaci TaxID=166011 RepID=A0A915D386_9BILA